jgi:hypothetical protein
MIKTLLRLKYNVKEGQELIENSLVTDILKYLNGYEIFYGDIKIFAIISRLQRDQMGHYFEAYCTLIHWKKSYL